MRSFKLRLIPRMKNLTYPPPKEKITVGLRAAHSKCPARDAIMKSSSMHKCRLKPMQDTSMTVCLWIGAEIFRGSVPAGRSWMACMTIRRSLNLYIRDIPLNTTQTREAALTKLRRCFSPLPPVTVARVTTRLRYGLAAAPMQVEAETLR